VRFDGIDALQGPGRLAGQPCLAAINSALQVDLRGNVNAETIDGRQVGTLGGHTDFLRAAPYSDGGRSIVVLPAATTSGSRSRIVRRLDSVTTPQSCVDFVVTEHGVAEIRGSTLGARGRALTALAAPEFRAELQAT
jgi:acyl-CoA hydrolase